MNVLITGACGFIGRMLIDELRESHDLTLLDRVQPSEATTFVPGSGARAAKPLQTDLPFIQAELTDAEAMRAAVKGQDAIVNLAGSPYGQPEVGVETFRTNALGTFIVLDAARLGGVKRVLCASSINAFGTIYWRLSGKPAPYASMPLDETFAPVPEDPYSLSKFVGEQTCAAFYRARHLSRAWPQTSSALLRPAQTA
jgi:UDP-glucose 4-epimerase